MAVLVRIRLGGAEATVAAESVARDSVHPKLIRLSGVSDLVLPERPAFVVTSVSIPQSDVLWFVEGSVAEWAAAAKMGPDPIPRGGS